LQSHDAINLRIAYNVVKTWFSGLRDILKEQNRVYETQLPLNSITPQIRWICH